MPSLSWQVMALVLFQLLLHSLSNRPSGVYQHYADDIPRYRSGTGTYWPNPKISVRGRNSSGSRRGNCNFNRSDNNGDREGNRNLNSKSRAAGHNHNRNHTAKSSSRLAASESQADRSWNSHRHDTFPQFQWQNGPLHSNSNQAGPSNVAYGMYSVQAMNSSVLSSNGSTVPSVIMFYPYDHNPNYGSHAEQLEFGSLGPVGFSGMNEQSHLGEGGRARGAFEEHRFLGISVRHSSPPEQPSSPRHSSHGGRRN